MATVNGTIAANADDGQVAWSGSAWAVFPTDSPIYWGRWSAAPELGYFGFVLSAAIPSGATITTTAGATKVTFVGAGDANMDEAYLYVTDAADAKLQSEAGDGNDYRPSWSGASGAQTTYPATLQGAGVVHWTGTWPADGSSVAIDVGPLIQYLVDTYDGLASGAHIVIWIDGDGATNNTESTIAPLEHATYAAPALLITYTEGGGAATNVVCMVI